MMSEFEFDNVEDAGPDEDPLEADSTQEAVAVSQWRNSQALAIGEKASEEWLTFDGDAVPVRR